jgi:hypothetical protein
MQMIFIFFFNDSVTPNKDWLSFTYFLPDAWLAWTFIDEYLLLLQNAPFDKQIIL